MSKLKNALGWFVTIETDEDDDVPTEAASEDPDVAAEAARRRVEEGPVGRDSGGKRASDYVHDPYAGAIDQEALGRATPDLTSSEGAFDEVYRAAGLSPAGGQGFTIYKVEKILASEHLSGLGDDAKKASILVTLQASGIGLDTIIQDAVSRDKALDQYDQMLRSEIKNLKTEVEIENADIEAQVEQFLERKRQEIAANNEKLTQAQEMYGEWQKRKIEEEERLFEAVSLFVDQNPITRDDG